MMDMNELYDCNKSFRAFVDRTAKRTKLGKDDVMQLKVTKEYAEFILDEEIFEE